MKTFKEKVNEVIPLLLFILFGVEPVDKTPLLNHPIDLTGTPMPNLKLYPENIQQMFLEIAYTLCNKENYSTLGKCKRFFTGDDPYIRKPTKMMEQEYMLYSSPSTALFLIYFDYYLWYRLTRAIESGIEIKDVDSLLICSGSNRFYLLYRNCSFYSPQNQAYPDPRKLKPPKDKRNPQIFVGDFLGEEELRFLLELCEEAQKKIKEVYPLKKRGRGYARDITIAIECLQEALSKKTSEE